MAFAQTVSTPNGPTLTPTYTPPSYTQNGGSTSGNIVLSWPANGASILVLEVSPSLAPAFWSDYGGYVVSSQGINTVTIVLPSTGNLYFRLASPGAH